MRTRLANKTRGTQTLAERRKGLTQENERGSLMKVGSKNSTQKRGGIEIESKPEKNGLTIKRE